MSTKGKVKQMTNVTMPTAKSESEASFWGQIKHAQSTTAPSMTRRMATKMATHTETPCIFTN